MALFAVTTFVVFHFGLGRDTLEGELAAGVLWITLLFAAILGIVFTAVGFCLAPLALVGSIFSARSILLSRRHGFPFRVRAAARRAGWSQCRATRG